jgi:hypothetical protein
MLPLDGIVVIKTDWLFRELRAAIRAKTKKAGTGIMPAE